METTTTSASLFTIAGDYLFYESGECDDRLCNRFIYQVYNVSGEAEARAILEQYFTEQDNSCPKEMAYEDTEVLCYGRNIDATALADHCRMVIDAGHGTTVFDPTMEDGIPDTLYLNNGECDDRLRERMLYILVNAFDNESCTQRIFYRISADYDTESDAVEYARSFVPAAHGHMLHFGRLPGLYEEI